MKKPIPNILPDEDEDEDEDKDIEDGLRWLYENQKNIIQTQKNFEDVVNKNILQMNKNLSQIKQITVGDIVVVSKNPIKDLRQILETKGIRSYLGIQKNKIKLNPSYIE